MSASNNIEQVSAILGQHLLAGWTMSAEACPNQDCVGCPLMYKGDAANTFCARCDKIPQLAQHSSRKSMAGTESSDRTIQPQQSPGSSSSRSMDSVSTPPTPSSQVTPAQDDLAAQIAAPAPPDVPHVSQAELDRRAQSDRASTAISEKMLQGWKLLSQECPNPECHGIPLMHPPKPRPEMDAADIMLNGPESGRINTSTTTSRKRSKHAKAAPLSDPRMLCVACGSRYLQESDVPAFDAYQAQQQQPQATVTTQQPEPQAQHSSMAGMAPTAMAGPPLQRRGEAPAQKPTLSPFVPEDTMTTAMRSTALPALPSVALPSINAPPASGPSDLSHTVQTSIEASLRQMSAYLGELSSRSPMPGHPMPTEEISKTAQAIGGLAQALKEVRGL